MCRGAGSLVKAHVSYYFDLDHNAESFFPDKVTLIQFALNCVSEPSLSVHTVCEVDSAPCGAFGDSEVFRGEDAIALLELDKSSSLLSPSLPPF